MAIIHKLIIGCTGISFNLLISMDDYSIGSEWFHCTLHLIKIMFSNCIGTCIFQYRLGIQINKGDKY